MTHSSNKCLITWCVLSSQHGGGGKERIYVSEISVKKEIDRSRVGEMVQGVRAPAANSNNLSLILRTYIVEGENQVPRVDL